MKNIFTKEDENLKWETKSQKLLLKTPVFEVMEHHNVSKNNVEGDYIVLDARDWVIVVPHLDDKFIMVKQWRHGEKKLSLEFPGGVIEKDEKPEVAAVRELEEETGYKAGKLTKIGEINPNPALFSNHLHVFLAEELVSTGEQHLDKDEFINTILLSEEEIFSELETGHFTHALMGTALAFYMKSK